MTRRAGPIAGFIQGAGDPFRGLAFLLGHPGLWPLAALPFMLTLAVNIAVLWTGWHFASGWLQEAVFDREGFAWAALGYVAVAAVWVFMIFVLVVLFIPLATVIASPFNDILSEKTEWLYRGIRRDEPFSLRSLWRGVRVGVVGDVARALKLMAWLALAFSFNLVPVIGQILAPVASAFFTIRYLALEYTSYSMDRRYFTGARKADFLRAHRARTLGFGLVAFGAMLVPLASAMFIPVSAIGGTLLFCDTELAGGGS